MKYCAMLLMSLSFSSLATVTPESCLDIDRSVGVGMIRAMTRDFKIDKKEVILKKTKMTLLDIQDVTEVMADFYAQEDQRELRFPDSELNEYADLYKGDNPKNLIIKYDFVNKKNKHNIFIASLLINDTECSVRFNNYITVRREF